jgi:hypothetical protein
LIEGASAVEHAVHGRYAGDVPTADINVEGGWVGATVRVSATVRALQKVGEADHSRDIP